MADKYDAIPAPRGYPGRPAAGGTIPRLTAAGLRALLIEYRRKHTYHVGEALNRGLTQEYRTWHHIMAQALEPLLDDLDALVADDLRIEDPPLDIERYRDPIETDPFSEVLRPEELEKLRASSSTRRGLGRSSTEPKPSSVLPARGSR